MTISNASSMTIISGATATGKTSYSIELAKGFIEQGKSPVIINFDSLLFYKELSIGTAKPTKEERENIDHQLIDIQTAKEPLNAHQYIELALPLIKKYQQKDSPIILVGGSAFYIRALVKGMYDSPPIDSSIREQTEEIFKSEGIDGIRKILEQHDSESLKKIHPNDHYRNIRAVEHWLQHRSPLSLEQKRFEKIDPYDFANNTHGWCLDHHYLSIEKERHWELILNRTEQMVSNGLIDEVENLLSNGFSGVEKPLQSIGYKETIQYLKKEIFSKEELIEKIYIATRRLAKSQKTFFKKISPKKIIHR